MGTATVVAEARKALGPAGVFLPFPLADGPTVDQQRDAARRLEAAGYRAAWTNEAVGGKDALVQLAVLLAATDRLVLGTSIANIWARAPQTAHGAATLLAQAFPGRLVLGLGVGYPHQAASVGRDFGKPLATMRGYLEQMTAPTQMSAPQLPAPELTYPRIIAANGPRMLALSGELADGAMPAMVPPEFTAQARQQLGPDKLLIIGLSFVADADPARAQAAARQRVAARLAMPGTYADTIARLGYSEQEITDVSNRLVDSLVAYGEGAAIAAKAAEHLAAGADHVMVMSGASGAAAGIAELEQLAPALARLGQ